MKKAILAFSWILMAVSFVLLTFFLLVVMGMVGQGFHSDTIKDIVQGAYPLQYMGLAIFLIAIVLNIIGSAEK